jgi:hypothetical protein
LLQEFEEQVYILVGDNEFIGEDLLVPEFGCVFDDNRVEVVVALLVEVVADYHFVLDQVPPEDIEQLVEAVPGGVAAAHLQHYLRDVVQQYRFELLLLHQLAQSVYHHLRRLQLQLPQDAVDHDRVALFCQLDQQ